MRSFFSGTAHHEYQLSISRQHWLVIVSAGALATFCFIAALRILVVSALDFPAILAINSLAHRIPILDHAVGAVAANELFQGLPIVALAFGASAASPRNRVRVAIGCIAAAVAAELSRLLQFHLPTLPRPLLDPALPFQRPYGSTPEVWRDWSSFPSDHATLLWGVAITTVIVNRRLGLLSIALASLSSLARVYSGFHYISDILGGALLAMAVVCAFLAGAEPWEERLQSFAKRRPALVATLAFFIGAQVATLFQDLRTAADRAAHRVKEVGAFTGERSTPGDTSSSPMDIGQPPP
jgi:undecaprenyl-diphosphatase